MSIPAGGRGTRSAEQLRRRINDKLHRRTPFRGFVQAVNGVVVTVKEYDSSDTTEEPFSQPVKIARGATLHVGDQVLVIPSSDGRDYTAVGISDNNSGAMRIESGTVALGSGKLFGALDFNSADFLLTQEDAAGIDTDTDEVNIDLLGILDDAKRGMFPYIDDGTAVVATNASTTTYVTLATFSIALPTGTWRYDGVAMMYARNNTAGNGGTIRFNGPNTSGGNFENSATANQPFLVLKSSSATGLTGTVTFTIEYRASSGGTVTPSRWYVDLKFRRTAL